MIRKFVVVAGVIGTLFFFIALIAIMGSLRPEVERTVAEPAAPIAFVEEVDYGPINLSVTTQGEVAPRREIQLAAQIGGRIQSVSASFANGGVFTEGDTLLTIEDADYQLAVTRARAQVAQAEQALAVEKAEAALAAQDYEELSGTDASSDPSLLALRKPQLASAEADLASAKANLAEAQLNLRRTKITAPFSGRVRSVNANVGQFVSPGQALGQVFSTDIAEIRLPLSDADLAKLQLPFAFEAKGDDAPDVIFSANVAGQERSWKGKVRRVDAAIDSSTRQIAAIAEVEDPYGTGADDGFPLAFGLFVEAEIVGEVLPRATIIPILALNADGTVLVVGDDDMLEARTPIVTGQAGEGYIVTGGLEPGEKLVVSLVSAGAGEPVRPLYRDGSSASNQPPALATGDAGDTGAAANGSSAGASQGANL